MNKRNFLKTSLIMGAGAFIAPSLLKNKAMASVLPFGPSSPAGEFTQVTLPYSFDALEPHIDAQTMEIHYSKHHAAYTKNFNQFIKDQNLTGLTIEEIFAGIEKYPAGIRNNGGGYYNHNFFWLTLSPNGGGEPTGALLTEIEKNFESFTAFKDAFSKAASSVFGSGWVWLIHQNDKLKIVTTPNQDNTLMSISGEKGRPLMCLDVWEHAYYLKYQNKRADYISAFWNLVNWEFVSENLKKA